MALSKQKCSYVGRRISVVKMIRKSETHFSANFQDVWKHLRALKVVYRQFRQVGLHLAKLLGLR